MISAANMLHPQFLLTSNTLSYREFLQSGRNKESDPG